MAIFARHTLIVNSCGANNAPQPPLPPSPPCIPDNNPSPPWDNDAQHIDMANIGTGVGIYAGNVVTTIGTTFEFASLVAGPNVSINRVGDEIHISATVSGAGGVQVVADIAARDALIPSLAADTLVFVQSDADLEYSMYLWDFTNTTWKKLATQDSAETSAASISYTLNFDSPSVIILGNASLGARVVDVSVRVITSFDGSPTLTIGDATNPSNLMDYDLMDLTVVDQYFTECNFTYTNAHDTDIKAYFNAGGSSIGQAQIIVSYV